MEESIRNIIPEIKQYSKLLSQKEYFINKTWLLINNNNDIIQYTFKNNGVLIIATNSIVSRGVWETLSPSKILIESSIGSIQFEHLFFDDSIMLLLKHSKVEEILILIDPLVIKDQNPLKYLEKLQNRKNPTLVQNIIGGVLFIISLFFIIYTWLH